MDHWAALASWGWIVVALLIGYGIGLIHGFYQHWFRGKVYCPRCLYYLNWRDTILREIVPKWLGKPRDKDPWERENPPAAPPLSN